MSLFEPKYNKQNSSCMEKPTSDSDWSSKESIRQADREVYYEVKKAIDCGIDINNLVIDENKYKNTPLISASSQGFADTVRLMLSVSGMNFKAKNNKGETALDVAKNEDVRNLLLDAEKGIFPTMLRKGKQSR